MSVTHTQTQAAADSTSKPGTARRLLQRQIMPAERDTDVIKLYVDPDPAALDADKFEIGHTRAAHEANAIATRIQNAAKGVSQIHPDQIESRTAYRVEHGETVSFGTYFNAFPASYWRRHTIVSEVRLTVRVRGEGAAVTVYRSLANGRSQRVDSATVEGSSGEFSFDLPLKPFVDGGWYWYDVVAADEDVVVESAEWTAEVPEDKAQHGTVTIGITTMNRQDFCAKLLVQLGESGHLEDYLDEVVVMEQGKDKVVGSEFFPEAEKALGGKLRIIEQGNIGGSGGFARAQYEGLKAGRSTYVMMLDDDVECETEGIVRAVTFGDLCRTTTIVGGHMFSIFQKTQLHSFGEKVEPYTFWWGSAPGVFAGWDFGDRNLRSTRWLHARIDVDYNGWFMCLIPAEVISDIGLSLPIFIKWDDSEYGLRAKAAGYPTVTFPGAAVWHVPWTDKNDALDWQSYFHVRNRVIAALLHSPYPRGGRLLRESFNHQVKHLVSMQYSTVELRHRALEDVLAGPHKLHEVLPTTLPTIKEIVKGYDDATLVSDPSAFPEVKRHKLPRKGKEASPVISGRAATVQALLQPLRQLRKPRELSVEHPEAEVMAQDARWHKIARYDSAVVSMPDGTAAAFYRRDREKFFDLLKRTVAIHRRLAADWDDLAEQYRTALPEITSPEAWERTFAPWMDGDGHDD
ncbi:glycosyltransferase [Nocardioides euryhalodurans]|uniref:Glycosyltransferase family 2 protein n=1 Tax=Nocardioides euryhalodurans TaxID=2518370 RepID=A0A4V1BDQ9_9ACTN|nr:glycosyltransferase [Nocardioides euryhalodurans]QBR91982.1 glycosyltransferase family 2 protein [Nocardioides euryhalodurans]